MKNWTLRRPTWADVTESCIYIRELNEMKSRFPSIRELPATMLSAAPRGRTSQKTAQRLKSPTWADITEQDIAILTIATMPFLRPRMPAPRKRSPRTLNVESDITYRIWCFGKWNLYTQLASRKDAWPLCLSQRFLLRQRTDCQSSNG